MRIVILSNKDLTSSLVFGKICKSKNFKVVGVAFSSTLTKKNSYLAGIIDIFNRTGRSYFWYMCFYNGIFLLKEKLYEIIPEFFSGKSFFSLRNYAKNANIETIDANNFNSSTFIKKINQWKPDIIVTRINQILKKEILKIPPLGCLCCHSSLLPNYRGIAAEFYNLLHDEKYAGFSIIKMTEKLDEGDIIAQKQMAISKKDTLYSLTLKNAKLGGKLLIQSLSERKNECITFKKQLSNKGQYYSWPNTKAVSQFKNKGRKFITVKELIRHITS